MTNKRYIIINNSDIIKKYTKDNQEYQDNLLTNEIFEKYDIPNHLRKIIIRNSFYTLNYNQKDFYELTTNIVLRVDIIKKLENNEYLLGGYFDNHSNTEINTVIKGNDPHDIKEFYQEIIDLGLAGNYQLAVKEILSNHLEIKKEPLLKIKTIAK